MLLNLLLIADILLISLIVNWLARLLYRWGNSYILAKWVDASVWFTVDFFENFIATLASVITLKDQDIVWSKDGRCGNGHAVGFVAALGSLVIFGILAFCYTLKVLGYH